VTEAQAMQTGVLAENLKLHEQLADLQVLLRGWSNQIFPLLKNGFCKYPSACV
jgi:hypothetical protein